MKPLMICEVNSWRQGWEPLLLLLLLLLLEVKKLPVLLEVLLLLLEVLLLEVPCGR